MKEKSLKKIMEEVRRCKACTDLPLGPNPIIRGHKDSKILLVGQAPGIKVHETGIPWNDASGERLREWMGIDRNIFYNEKLIAILPVGFCYPGKGIQGDLPPSKECFKLWHRRLTSQMPNLKMTVLLGSYAHHAYLGKMKKSSLTETVKAWEEFLPEFIPLPHPSPLNNIWLHKNKWFNEKVVPNIKPLILDVLYDRCNNG